MAMQKIWRERINPIPSKTDHAGFGLTKLEYFAALAMQGLLACTDVHSPSGQDDQQTTAQMAVEFALDLCEELDRTSDRLRKEGSK